MRRRSRRGMVVQLSSYLLTLLTASLLLLLHRSYASTMLASFTSEVGGGKILPHASSIPQNIDPRKPCVLELVSLRGFASPRGCDS